MRCLQKEQRALFEMDRDSNKESIKKNCWLVVVVFFFYDERKLKMGRWRGGLEQTNLLLVPIGRQ